MVVICMEESKNSSYGKSDKNREFWQNMDNLGFGALFLDDISMTSSGGVRYGRVTWWPVSGPRGWGTWRTTCSDGGSGADAGST